MERTLYPLIREDLSRKMILLTGPRQVGKTYLAKQLRSEFRFSLYLNYDDPQHMKMIQEGSWSPETDLLVLDELHKMRQWKSFLKGTYDTRPDGMSLLVTGSARMETFRQEGESLAGRYFHHRLHPLTVRELSGVMSGPDALAALNQLGGFPEPFLSGSDRFAQRWRNQYFTDIIREDILDYSRIQEIRVMHLLLELIRGRIGSPISYSSLARDLQISPHTVKSYLDILESLFIIFRVYPFGKNIARAVIKEPKVYLYDTGHVKGGPGVRLENTAACCLLRHVQYQQDVKGEQVKLHYLRTKDKREVDFLIAESEQPVEMIEVKHSDKTVSKHLHYFKQRYPQLNGVQIVQTLQEPIYHREADLHIRNAAEYLAALDG